jgi:hypothetical protein
MARPRSYHQDRALTQAERAKAYRERRKRAEDGGRHETTVTKPRHETTVTKPRHETRDRNETRATAQNKIRSRDAFEWTDELKYRLVSKTNAGLTARGLRAEDRKAVQIVIQDDVMSEPPFDKMKWENLRSRYYEFRHKYQNPPQTVALQQGAERWISLMGKWGPSPKLARERVNFLIDVAKGRLPANEVLAFIENRLFGHAERSRWGDSTKVRWIEAQIKKLADPFDFTRKPFRKKSKSADIVLPIVRRLGGRASRAQIAKELKKSAPRGGKTIGSAEHHIIYLCKTKELVRVGYGVYSEPGPGVVAYVDATDAVRDALAVDGKTIAEIMDETDKPWKTINAALYWLREKDDVYVVRRGHLRTYFLKR